ncbi:MAG TPA: IS4 family transposase [Candidatus Sulfotelmatobacter sp.]|nr:IS4 family transposase [Candidatus Sulfotelmatobacter sp.]
MASSIAQLPLSLKQKAAAFLNPVFIATVARPLGFTWRNTPLALPHLVAFFARQILGGNLSMPELARRAGSAFTPEAFCIARGKLPITLLRHLLQRIGEAAGAAEGRWKGHRLWHMDGTGISMPDTPALQKRFGQSGQQKPGCGFPTSHVLCLFDVASGLLQDCIPSPLRTHDMADAGRLHPYLAPGDILIADRAFESFVHLAMLIRAGIHAILPAHQKRRIDFRRKRRRRSRGKPPTRRCKSGRKPPLYDREVIRKCDSRDQIVRWRRPVDKPDWISQEEFDSLPETITVRELRRCVVMDDGCRLEITLITTLLEEKRYLAEELLAVLKARWGVEVNLRHLKTTMKMNILRSKTVAGIEREIWMYAIVYNAVRLVMLEAAAKQQTAVERLSFADALYWVRHGDLALPVPKLSLVLHRPGRVEPRLLKRRRDQYGRLTKPRQQMRKASRRRRSRYKI